MGGFTPTLTFVTMPHYTCHKKVGALEISGVDGFTLTFTNGNTATLYRDIFARYTPVPGDFLVVYEDGYMSFSPRKAFLDGYAREEAQDAILLRIDQAMAPSFGIEVGAYEGLMELLRDCQSEIQRLRLKVGQSGQSFADIKKELKS